MHMHMDVLCFGGTNNFQGRVVKTITEKLRVGSEEKDMFKYIGIDITDRKRNRIMMVQSQYIKKKVKITLVVQEKHERILSQVERKRYRSVVGQLNWLA